MGVAASVVDPNKELFSKSSVVAGDGGKSLNLEQFSEASELYGQGIFTNRECKNEYSLYDRCVYQNRLRNPKTEEEKQRLRQVCEQQIDVLSQCINDKAKWDKLMKESGMHPKCRLESERLEKCRHDIREAKTANCDVFVYENVLCGLKSTLDDLTRK